MTHHHIERIRKLFLKLKSGYGWCQRNKHNQIGVDELFNRSERIFKELESLGVERIFSMIVLIFGPHINDELVQQFDEKEDEK